MSGAERPDQGAETWARIGHDLRQPLYAAQLLLGALQRTDDAGKRDEIGRDLRAALDSMESLLDATLALAKLTTGKVTADLRDVAVDPLVGDVTRLLRPLAVDKGLELRRVRTTCKVRTDPALLSTILANLAGNAVRYCDTGKVLIGCRRRGAVVHIEIWDQGAGIPADCLPRLFDEFFQILAPGRDRGQGVGLGLSIVRRTAEVLGHKLYVDSRAGVGSKFAVAVPAAV